MKVKLHVHVNEDGDKFYHLPSEVERFSDGFHFKNGLLHRLDGPAIEWTNGNKEWWVNGERHRLDGPTFEGLNGDKEWYINGKLHREDGPAVEWTCGFKAWYINGKRHREDGPAIENIDGTKEWYINGNVLSYEEWFEYVMTHSSKENQINVLLKMDKW